MISLERKALKIAIDNIANDDGGTNDSTKDWHLGMDILIVLASVQQGRAALLREFVENAEHKKAS